MYRKFEIGIPTLNRYDLLKPTLEKYQNDFSGVKIHIVDNGKQGICGESVYAMPINLGVAASWNFLCNKIFENADYAVILNDDIYLGYSTEVIHNAIENCGTDEFFLRSENSWSMFVISKAMFNRIGKFDEIFYPAYYEDSDYIYRMNLAGIRQLIDKSLNPVEYRISSTYEKAPDLVNEAMQTNRERYIKKWGGLPLLEKYTMPYGTER